MMTRSVFGLVSWYGGSGYGRLAARVTINIHFSNKFIVRAFIITLRSDEVSIILCTFKKG